MSSPSVSRDTAGEAGDLRDPVGSRSVRKLDGTLLELPLQPKTLRLEQERVRVAVGQRALDLLELRPGRSRQRADVVEHRRAVGIHRHPIDYPGCPGLAAWAARPIFLRSGTQFARRIAGTLVVALLLPAAATASLRGQLHARSPASTAAAPRRSRSTRERKSGLRAQRERGPPPRLEREARRHLRRARRPRPVVPDAHRGARRRPSQGRRRLGRRPRPQGLRRPLSRRRRPRRARARPACEWDPARDRPAAGRRVVLRLAARRAWVEAVVRRPASRARSRRSVPEGAAATANASAGRSGGRASASAADTKLVRAAAGRSRSATRRRSTDPPPHGRRERQLPRGDGAEEPRCGRRAAGHDRRGRLGRACDPRRAEDPARRRPDRGRLRPVLARPPDPQGARHDPAADLGRPRPPAGRPPDPAGRRPRRDAARPDAERPRARQRPREDRHARQRVGALGVRPRPLRVLDPGQLASAVVLRPRGPRRTGSRRCSPARAG